VDNLCNVAVKINELHLDGSGGREMKKIHILVLSAILLAMLAACAPGSSVQVNAPATSIRLSAPGPNPQINQPDVAGRVARAGAGLWHGIIAPVTLLISFFNSDVQMYEVHNDGSGYNIGFLLGVALVFFAIGLIVRMRR